MNGAEGMTTYPISGQAGHGWASRFPAFRETPALQIRGSLQAFLTDAAAGQIRAWDMSIPPLQYEVGEVLTSDRLAGGYSAILEYQLPLEFRRPDVIFLTNGSVLVLELKGKSLASQADIDQAAGYVRDLRAYHRECADHFVHGAVVLTEASGRVDRDGDIQIVGIDAVDQLVNELSPTDDGDIVSAEKFLSAEAYQPLPSLIEAARELFEHGDLRHIRRAAAATEPALHRITEIVHEAARTKTRRLILLTGVPGSGKTLIGLQVAHARWLDDLAVPRPGGRPVAPAVFLSGNGPLVEVLQYELRSGGGGGKAFVRGVKEYVEYYMRRPNLMPPEHVLVFDEAQRAFDAPTVEEKHPDLGHGRSEPELFVEFAERVPEWCVVIGLIGSGQEIHVGEEAGAVQWRWAVERSRRSAEWVVHTPPDLVSLFDPSGLTVVEPRLRLDEELRYHLAEENHAFVAQLLGGAPAETLAPLAERLEARQFNLRITRDLDAGRRYLRDRYSDDPMSRFGLLASSKDRILPMHGVYNDFQSTKRVQFGPWYGEGDGDYLGRSCRELRTCVTEFGSQGLELDGTLLGWGNDFVRLRGAWTNEHSRGYRRASRVRDPFQLRVNAYRVLLTRARDGTVVFVPPVSVMDETYAFLRDAGFRPVERT